MLRQTSLPSSLFPSLLLNISPAPGTQTDGGSTPYLTCLRPEEKLGLFTSNSVQFSSVTQSCLTLCDPMNRSTPSPTPGVYSNSTPIESVMPPSHLILCRPLLLLPPIPPRIRVFSNESTLRMRWPKFWSFGFSISPSSEHPGLISFRMGWLDLFAVKGLSRVFSNTTVQKHQFFGVQLSL